jgi:anti-anti-sigma factor
LRSSKISFRHAYLQALDERVLCVDLTSKTSLCWGDKRRSYGWLTSANSVRIGPYHLRLADEPSGECEVPIDEAQPDPLNEPVHHGLFPKYCLELFDDSVTDPMRSIDRRITLIGRDDHCALQLADASVSRVHCALVLNQDGLWVVDLLGKGGVQLDGKPVQIERAQNGSELVVGNQVMAFWLHDSDWLGPANEKTHESGTTAHAETMHGLGGLDDWLGTLFAVEYQKDALVVMPTIRSGMFRYAKLQLELNALRHKLLQSEVSRVLFDLSALDYAGSEVICALVALARQTESRGGRIALCSATGQAESALHRMGLSRIWTLYPTRDSALAALDRR